MSALANRRQFLGLVSAGIMMPVLPGYMSNGSQAGRIDKAACLNALIDACVEDEMLWSSHDDVYRWSPEDTKNMAENLSYAFAAINPQSYDEFTFVTTCRWNASREFADEYVRRKNGRTPQLPDHPLFSLHWCLMPDTRRILVFREQIESLFTVLMAPQKRGESLYRYQFIRDELSFGDFMTRVNVRYKTALSREELKTLYEGIRRYAPCACPYIGRSAIVSHAFSKLNVLLRKWRES